MLTLYRRILKQPTGFLTPLWLAMALGAGLTMNVQAQLPPANDNVANAQAIVGSSGSVAGENLNATSQIGEPAPFTNNPAQASIWYIWTAPYTTTIDFNTRGSTDPLTGLDLNTVLAVYTNAPGSNAAFATLKQVASDMIDPSYLSEYSNDPTAGYTSRVDFPVTVGQVYYIQVDGSTNGSANTPPGSNAVGDIELNWAPSLVAGTFGFSAATYFPGILDDEIDVQDNPLSTGPSLANRSGANNIRITVVRQGSAVGRCEVTLSMTNLIYTNIFGTNIYGTNFYTTNFNTNGFASNDIVSITNVLYTNYASQLLIQSYINGGSSGILALEQFPVWNVFGVTQTNVGNPSPVMAGSFITNSISLAGLGLTNFFTNFPCTPMMTATTNTNGAVVTVSVTQVFCMGTTYVTNTTPTASNGVDYVNITTNLTFNDFQMSQDVYLQINPNDALLPGPDYPDTNGFSTLYGANSFVKLTLSNPVLDPNEDPDITPPTLGQATSGMNIQNFNLNPNNYMGSSTYLVTNTSPGTYCTVNLERATFRVNKGVGTAYLYAVLSGSPGMTSYTFNYTIDENIQGEVGTPLNAFDYNRFPTVAGSDYAQPSFAGVLTAADFGTPINNPPDPSGNGVGGKTTWSGVFGSITFGSYPNAPTVGEIAIPILTNGAVEFDMDLHVELFQTQSSFSADEVFPNPCFLGAVNAANLTINFGGADPGGSYEVSFNPDNSPTSVPQPNNRVPGANPPPNEGGYVRAVAIQPNGQAIIGGNFSDYNTIPVSGIARLLPNGFLDTNFNNVLNGGVNGFVEVVTMDASGRILIGGSFSSYDGNATPAPNIARLNTSGSQDTTFTNGIGFNGIVYALAVDANGNILVGGDFTSYNTVSCSHIARLLPSGQLDPSFLPDTGNGGSGFGANHDVRAVATDGNGNIIVGGLFTSFNGSNINYLARLLPSGALDPAFNPEIGPDAAIYSLAIEPNNEIVIGGAFQNYNLVNSPGVALVAVNGSLDTSFVPGAGADGIVYSVSIQPANGDILVAGQFRNFNLCRRLGVARLLPNGWLDTSFMDTSYNQFAGLINVYHNDPVNTAYALGLQPDGNIIVGGSFTNIGGGGTRTTIHSQINVTRIVGTNTLGPQTGGGGIGNDPGNVTLTQNPYTVDDTGVKLFVTLERTNGSLGAAELTLGTNTLSPGPGAATAADFGVILPDQSLYNEVWNNWTITPSGTYAWREGDGYYGFNNAIQPIGDFGSSALNLNIFDDKTALQDLFANISELNLNSQDLLILGGVPIPTQPALGLTSASMEIVNNNFQVGYVGFGATNYTAVNTSNSVTLTVFRTNGTAGQASVEYYTQNGTAISNVNYTGAGAGALTTLTFPGGSGALNNSTTFTIPILNTGTTQSNKTFKVFLTDPTPGGLLNTNFLPTAATVTIIDGNFAPGHLSFISSGFTVAKGGLAAVGVQRLGGASGELTVQCGTSDGSAKNGLNYTGATNTLSWGNQDASTKTMTFQTLQDNTIDGPLTVNLALFNATNVGSTNNDNLILSFPSNAVDTILEEDSYGTFSFAAPNFNVLQNAGQALITVVRSGGTTGTVVFGYNTFPFTNAVLPDLPAVAGSNYSAGISSPPLSALTFGPGVTSQSFVVPVLYTPAETNIANRQVYLQLVLESPAATNFTSNNLPGSATLTILDPQLILNPAGSVDLTTQNGVGFNDTVSSLALQPDGSVLAGGEFTFFNQYPFEYVARLNPNGSFDNSFLFNQTGANSNVLQVLSQTPGSAVTNGPIVIVGGFSQVDQVNRSGIARLNLDGSLDETFNPGSGADSTIFAVAEASVPTLAFYIGGDFANFNNAPSGGIARLNGATNSPGLPGTLDPDFNVLQGVTGSNGTVRALAVQANNQVILGGDFTSFNSQPYNHLVRLNIDGSVDTTFNAGTGSASTDSVRAIVVQPDGRILVGGLFTNVNGSNYNYLARLNADGSLDTNFNVSTNFPSNGGTNGGNNGVLALALDSQERILVGGEFTSFSGVTRSGITRLNPDGTLDPTINFGSGADGGFVNSIVVQTNDEIDVGGGFSTFEGISENNFVRLYGLANSGDGSIQFSQGVFGVLGNATNAIVTLQRLGGEGTAAQPTVSITFSTSDGTALAGTNYTAVTTNITFPLGETFENVIIPITNNAVVGSNTFLNLSLSNPVFATIGTQPTAILIITNVNSAVSFSAQSYTETADAPTGEAVIPIVRIGNPNSTVGVSVYTGTNGTAAPFTNYVPTSNFIVFNPGVMTNFFDVPVLNAPNMFSDLTVDLEMSGFSNTFSGSPSSALLTIDSVNTAAGVLVFSQPSYSVQASTTGETNAVITVLRTNGSSGPVSVTLTTANGTAIAGTNYLSVLATLNFADGQLSASTNIPVLQQSVAGPNLTVFLTLSNPTGGATIGGANQETLTIDNNIEYFSFSTSPYFVTEGGTVTVGIVRGGPVSNSASINYFTSELPNASEATGGAISNIDYVPASGTLTYPPFVTNSTIPIVTLQGNSANGPLSFFVNLSSTNNNIQTAAPNPATVIILSDVTGFALSTNAYAVAEDGSNVVITVTRLNPNTGAASVQYATSNGTNQSSALNAVSGVDYVSTSGVLNFVNGQASNSFTVTILNPNIVENNKTFNVALSNPLVLTLPNPSTNAYLLSPSNATVTITNVLTGVSFGNPTFNVSECAVEAVIPVILTGVTNNLVSVVCSTVGGGTASAGTNYVSTATNFTFQPGQTTTNFLVPVINNHVIGPDHTVVMSLSNPQRAQLLSPSTAILTIQECNGAFIVESGTAFVSGTPNNGGVMFPNETVTILFGLRDIAGNNTTNLVATLLATNGVTAPSGPQDYGVLTTDGPTVARPFTFTVAGTNGQNIIANFTLTDGTAVYPNVAFGFTLGGQTTTFSTNETLLLYGSNNPPSKAHNTTNPPNYGYPSEINVSGVVGNVTGVTMNVTNFGHTYVSDVALVLESPGGQNALLMSDCGGTNNVQHVSLTFSQSAGGYLPQSSTITSGTYLPTAYGFILDLPTNAPGFPQPPLPPFSSSMGTFVGQSPNGTWSLYAADNDELDSGYISNGWSLTISTGIPVENDADLEVSVTNSIAAITLSNTLTYIIGVTNYGPSTATNVIITDTLPLGVANVSDSFGATPVNGVLTDTIATMAVSNGVTLTIQLTPTNLGSITNTVMAVSSEPDPNSNYVAAITNIVSPASADVGVGLSASPNPVINGGNVTYTIVVYNNGPSTAPGVTAVNVLPAGFKPVTITPAPASTNSGIITWNMGTMNSGLFATNIIVAQVSITNQAGLPSSSLDSVTVNSTVYDPAKLNNFASVKTEVEPAMLMLAVTNSGTNHSISWPVESTNIVLYGTATLSGPWVVIPNPVAVGGVYTFALPGTNGYHYFSLGLKLP